MNYRNFLAEVLKEGLALGVGPGAAGGRIEEVWGVAPLEDVQKKGKMKRWDYGLAEFSLALGSDWFCSSYVVQLHRLARHGDAIVPSAVLDAYGKFPRLIQLADIVDIGEIDLKEKESPGGGFSVYRVSGSEVQIHVFMGDEGEPGRVWSIDVFKRY